jgi:hypothetical protein
MLAGTDAAQIHTAEPWRCLCLQVALSSFSFLFCELVQYCQSRVTNVSELERKWVAMSLGISRYWQAAPAKVCYMGTECVGLAWPQA